MILIRDVVVVLVVMVLQIARCELAVASLLIGAFQEAFNVTDGYQQFCSKRSTSALKEKRKLQK